MPPKYTVSTALNYLKAEVFPGGSDAKESACNAGDLGRTPEFRRSPGGGHGNPLPILAWRIPWTEEPRRLQSMGSQRAGHNLMTNTHLKAVSLKSFYCVYDEQNIF